MMTIYESAFDDIDADELSVDNIVDISDKTAIEDYMYIMRVFVRIPAYKDNYELLKNLKDIGTIMREILIMNQYVTDSSEIVYGFNTPEVDEDNIDSLYDIVNYNGIRLIKSEFTFKTIEECLKIRSQYGTDQYICGYVFFNISRDYRDDIYDFKKAILSTMKNIDNIFNNIEFQFIYLSRPMKCTTFISLYSYIISDGRKKSRHNNVDTWLDNIKDMFYPDINDEHSVRLRYMFEKDEISRYIDETMYNLFSSKSNDYKYWYDAKIDKIVVHPCIDCVFDSDTYINTYRDPDIVFDFTGYNIEMRLNMLFPGIVDNTIKSFNLFTEKNIGGFNDIDIYIENSRRVNMSNKSWVIDMSGKPCDEFEVHADDESNIEKITVINRGLWK